MTGVICDIIESLGFLEEETKEILSRLPQGAPYPTAKPEKQAALSRCTPISLLISKFSTVDVSLGQDQIGRCAWARPKQERTTDAVKAPLLEGANHRRCRTCVQYPMRADWKRRRRRKGLFEAIAVNEEDSEQTCHTGVGDHDETRSYYNSLLQRKPETQPFPYHATSLVSKVVSTPASKHRNG